MEEISIEELILDDEKIKAIEKFIRRGGTRRQDHGCRQCSLKGQHWFDWGYFNKDEPRRQERRRVFKRNGIFD